ncbi:MAG: type II secretion system protein GspD [Candidatus Binatia bacterium]
MKIGIGAIVTLVLVAQIGCAAPKVAPSPAALPPQAPEVSIERPAQKPLPGLIVSEIEGKKEAGRLYSFSLRDADIREVLMAIAKQTDFNIVVDPDVQGRVTVDLKNVSLTEALDTLTELLDLTYRARQNLIRVSRPAVETRIFSLHYVNLKRSGSSSTTAQIGAGGTGGGGMAGTPAGTTGTVGATTGATGTGGSQGAIGAGGGSGQTAVTTSTETDLWRDIEGGLTKLLSPSGKVVVDKQSGNILVADFPKFLDRIAGFLESIEGSVQRQVLIEARIIEVSLSGKYQFGLDWSAISKAGALRGFTTIAPTRILAQKLAPTESSFQFGVTSTDFEALLAVLQTQGEVNVLSSPKLATLNNQTAIIRSATDEVFFEPRVVLVPSGDTVVQTTDVTTRTVTIGVVLSVTPQISSDGSIVLHVRPTVTDSTRRETFTQQATSTTGSFTITVPVVDVREADVIVRAREGEMVVIGGLIQERKSDNESKVPLLGDIPGIGRLFRSTTQERRKTELVVFLSPTVLVGKKVDEIAARELERLKRTKGGSPW